jgi:preprotein translocase subunit SecA
MWEQLLVTIRRTIARAIFHVGLSQQPVAQPARTPVPAGSAPAPATSPARVPATAAQNLRENRPDQAATPAAKVNGKKIGRNDPCWCGSGKKYKRCHGVAA